MLSEEDDRRYEQARKIDYPVYLRHERRPGWSGDLPIYVLWCGDCRKWSENYPAGHAGRIHCNGCRSYVALNALAKWKRELLYTCMTVAPRTTIGVLRLYNRLFKVNTPELVSAMYTRPLTEGEKAEEFAGLVADRKSTIRVLHKLPKDDDKPN